MIEDLKAIGKTPLSEKVYSTLVESIVKGTLPSGKPYIKSRTSSWIFWSIFPTALPAKMIL